LREKIVNIRTKESNNTYNNNPTPILKSSNIRLVTTNNQVKVDI